MSSFQNPHHIYLFAMKNGKKKLSYGTTADDAFENLRLRLSDAGAGGHLLAQNCLIQLRGRLIVSCLSSLISSLSDIEITLRNHATL